MLPDTDQGDATLWLVWVPCSSREEATLIARTVVDERLAVCAHVLPPMHSIFRWQGAVESSDETALLLNTGAAQVDRLSARITALHGYDLVAITAWPANGTAAMAGWLQAELGE